MDSPIATSQPPSQHNASSVSSPPTQHSAPAGASLTSPGTAAGPVCASRRTHPCCPRRRWISRAAPGRACRHRAEGAAQGQRQSLGTPRQQQPGPHFAQTWVPGAQRPHIGVWGFCPRLFPVHVGLTGKGKQRLAGSTGHTYTKPAFFWSCRLSHTNSRYRRRTHEVLAVKALLLVCKITHHGNNPGD